MVDFRFFPAVAGSKRPRQPESRNRVVAAIYGKLLSFYGPRKWWPGDSPFEVAVGAILTQNTNWSNVEKAIINLKQKAALCPFVLHKMAHGDLSAIIRPAGYYNVKTKRLKAFLKFLMQEYGGDMDRMAKADTARLRPDLLAINGIGPETADSILLYALGKPVFVIDAYTKRIMSRHGILGPEVSYEAYQDFFHRNMKTDTAVFNEYHALIVNVGKDFCRPRPRCEGCPLEKIKWKSRIIKST
jgi:endonuclease III related protein